MLTNVYFIICSFNVKQWTISVRWQKSNCINQLRHYQDQLYLQSHQAALDLQVFISIETVYVSRGIRYGRSKNFFHIDFSIILINARRANRFLSFLCSLFMWFIKSFLYCYTTTPITSRDDSISLVYIIYRTKLIQDFSLIHARVNSHIYA